MTMKPRHKKSIAILTGAILTLALGVPFMLDDVHAATCSTDSSSTACKVATQKKSVKTNGNKITLVAENLSLSPSCTATNKNMASVNNWMRLDSTNWVQIGEGTGFINGSCEGSDIIYTYRKVNGVGGWTTNGAVNHGNSYNLEINDKLIDKNWEVFKNGSPVLSVSTSISTGNGEVGAEIRSTSNTIPETEIRQIQFYDTAWHLWSTGISITEDAPPYHDTCTADHKIHVGTSSAISC